MMYLKRWKEKYIYIYIQPRIVYTAKFSFSYNGEIYSFTDKQKITEFSTTKPTLNKMLNELLQAGKIKEATTRNKKITNGKGY